MLGARADYGTVNNRSAHPIHFVHPAVIFARFEDAVHDLAPVFLRLALFHDLLDRVEVFEFHEPEHVAVTFEDGHVAVPDGPGMGVDVDWDWLDEHGTGTTVID